MNSPEQSNPYPDNVYFEGAAVSWNGESQDGHDARLGVIQAGFNETFPIPESGERIWLYEPDGSKTMTVNVLDRDGAVVSSHTLQGEGMVHVMGGYDINVVTPVDQGPITYQCDYPGVEPGSH
jgi:hypothetical protein